jgi:hypothetical protein
MTRIIPFNGNLDYVNPPTAYDMSAALVDMHNVLQMMQVLAEKDPKLIGHASIYHQGRYHRFQTFIHVLEAQLRELAILANGVKQ